MRISDWSSDVCSSDLDPGGWWVRPAAAVQRAPSAPAPVPAAFANHRKSFLRGSSIALGQSPAPPTAVQPATEHSRRRLRRSEEHTSELQSLMRISYAVFCLKKKNNSKKTTYISSLLIQYAQRTKTKMLSLSHENKVV